MVLTPISTVWSIRKRDGRVVTFDQERIARAIAAAFQAEFGPDRENPAAAAEVERLTMTVVARVLPPGASGPPIEIERVQDFVEEELMRAGHFAVARRYILYRGRHQQVRLLRGEALPSDEPAAPDMQALAVHQIRRQLLAACTGLAHRCPVDELQDEVLASLYDGISPEETRRATIMAARARIERDPAYDTVATRLLLDVIYREAWEVAHDNEPTSAEYRARFSNYLDVGIAAGRLSEQLRDYDATRLCAALVPERDGEFGYLGLQTIYDRYLIDIDGRRIETPQYFWMRVAMGLALGEGARRHERAIEFYQLLSAFRVISATPTLFNSGTPHPQLSSCYLTSVQDDLEQIFKAFSDNARLSKWAGGLGNDWTNIRATGSLIKGTHGESQGVIPFLKIVNDTAVAVNQGGKRKGAVCAYLETWHLDIEDFLDLRKNTGDERRRTHDMNTANWIPDLFMRRVEDGGTWTLFSPNDVPDLHDRYGRDFAAAYLDYERRARAGEILLHKEIDAVQLWRKILSMLFETGHPWITFKDPSNIRSSQDHAGVVHNSNLCTEILLNTSADETAVCNLASINLAKHTGPDGLDAALLADTVRTALRMLDNVIDINFYPTPEARNANLRHRPVGLGIMGFQDALAIQRIGYSSEAAVTFADRSMELISYHAILASSALAEERGTYGSYAGSKWDRGLLPIDTIALLAEARGGDLDQDSSASLDWTPVRQAVATHGVRNSNMLAIAPTATISNICGVSQSIEPHYRNLFVKSNLSGEFTVINPHLVADLQARGLWDAAMLDDLKYFDGSVQQIDRVPDEIKALYLTAFEIDPSWLIECASRRQKWIDMGQSLNLYLAQPSGKALHDTYFLAWRKGLKTTYYLRSLAATQIEKSNMDLNRRGFQPRWMKSRSATSDVTAPVIPTVTGGQACAIDDPECEACQ